MVKESEDLGDGLAELLGKLAKDIKENPIKVKSDFKYPMQISSIKINPLTNINNEKTGSLVSIRPCGDEYKNKTYLGIYMGKIPIGINVGLYTETNILEIMNRTNPAIFVPDLKKVIFGYESWWGEIESEEQLKKITDNDIDNVWYVKALKQLDELKNGHKTGTEDNGVSSKD